MIINKNSWHYKFWSWTYTNRLEEKYPPSQTNLCSYVQRMIWIPLSYLMMALVVLAALLMIIGGAALLEYKAWSTHPYVSMGVHISLVVVFIVCFGSIFWRLKDNSTVIVVREYLSAKKQGICPVIEFNDNE